MLYNIKKLLPVILFIILVVACKSVLYVPSKSNVATTANIDSLTKGRALYISNCSSCHTLRIPERYTKKEWAMWMEKMALKAKINDQQKELILAYVTKGE
jgi:mono/diheme cytochrome c family protein